MMSGSSGQPVVVVGGGGMGRSVLDVIDAVNQERLTAGIRAFEVVGVVADPEPDVDLLAARGVKYLGGVTKLAEQPADVTYVIAIASGRMRRKLDRFGQSLGRYCPTIVHPNAHLGFDVQLGPGVVICSHVSVESHVRFGRHVHVNQNSTVGHDTVLGDYVTVSPMVAISGNVTAGQSVFFGTGSAVREKVTLGGRSTVGMGAAVTVDVPPGVTVVGVPAKPMD